ncbi:hypothetical protein H3146_06730 [Streptomyces sp. OF3]|uniref:DNA-binding protein n=1 Tax=Streptomyces alkaliterrae TaxID=2213162 RepID=A0A7W3WIR8_9ACTN|nr:hypothetical protein [Streptomyces alkaliterrae]MBB1253064.1 hypothetical protein [Streptomyces alkaliterrae]
MNTTLAAAKARRTVATIRHWCRLGAVAATKTGGRWVIDEASLNYRISLDKPAPKPVIYSTETMTAIGGNRWTKAGKDRVYLDWTAFVPLEISRYNTGNIASAAWNGEAIANRQAGLLLGSIDKVYFDAHTGKLHARFGYSESRVATRDEVWQTVVAGVRAAIAAL